MDNFSTLDDSGVFNDDGTSGGDADGVNMVFSGPGCVNAAAMDGPFGKLVKKPTEKIFNDSVHGEMRFPAYIMCFIDTVQFQRLKKLRQNGNCFHVFPNANHTRFEHSLGTCYLSEVFVRDLQRRYPSLISSQDVACVMIAALCHDLGHGPNSHLWEQFVKEVRAEENSGRHQSAYKHEDMTIKVFDDLVESNGLKRALEALCGLDDQDFTFIKEAMTGLPIEDSEEEWPYQGRGEEKAFLYEIVANKVSGMDVDKWDYLLRDNYLLNIGTKFRYRRFIPICRLESDPENGRRKIMVFRDSEANDGIRKLIGDRTDLHRSGYQHPVVKIIDRMTVDMYLLAAKGGLTIKLRDGRELPLAEAGNDVEAHMLLDESSLMTRIELSDIKPAQKVLQRLWTRSLYHKLMTLDISKNSTTCPMELRGKKDANIVLQHFLSHADVSDDMKADFTAFTTTISTGMTGKKIYVYSKPEDDADSVSVRPMDTQELFGTTRHSTTILLKNNAVIKEAELMIKRWKDSWKVV